MRKKSFRDIIEKDEFNITLHAHDFEFNMCGNRNKDEYVISSEGISIAYNITTFLKAPTKYVAEQELAHRQYYALIEPNLYESYKKVHSLLQVEKNLEESLEYTSEVNSLIFKFITKVIPFSKSFFKISPLRETLKQSVDSTIVTLDIYYFLRNLIQQGQNFISNVQLNHASLLDKTTNINLKKWEVTQSELLYLYDCFISSTNNELNTKARIYHFLD